jgi:hypothetical protein
MQTDVAISLLYDRIVMLEREYNKERDRADRADADAAQLLSAGVLALHKIEQTLAGQYPDGGALMAAVGPLRDAIAKARGEKPTRE